MKSTRDSFRKSRSIFSAATRPIAKNFDMEVIAEGVESDEQVTLLREFGCQEVQGFLYSKALPRPVFDHWLAARTASSDALPAHAVEPSHG